MNQILMNGNKGGRGGKAPVDIKKVIIFFCVALIIFGAIFVVKGVIGVSKNKNEEVAQNPDAIEPPAVENTEEPDMGDNQPPTIELLQTGKMIRIVARDETEIDYIEYRWNDEESQVVEQTNDKNKIETVVELRQGMNTLKVRAVDMEGNENTKDYTYKGEYQPVLKIYKNPERNGLVMIATCEDGIGRIEFTQYVGDTSNSYKLPVQESDYTEDDFKSLGAEVEYADDGETIKKITYTFKGLIEGENKFSISIYSTTGRVEAQDVTWNYPDQ